MDITVTPAEEALLREVLRVSRMLQHAGGFEVRLRPGMTPSIMRVAREKLSDFRPLNDSESYATRQASKRAV